MSYDIKTAVAELCQAKAKMEQAVEDRQILQKVLLSDDDFILKQTEEKQAVEQYEVLRKKLEEDSYGYMKDQKTDKGTIFSDFGKISFKIELSPIIKEEEVVIAYLNENGMQEYLKQAIRSKELKMLALTQTGENQIPGITIEEQTKLTISI